MEYNQVTFTAYLCAALMSLLLAGVFAAHYLSHRKLHNYALAALVQALNLGLIAQAFSNSSPQPYTLLIAECLHFSIWVLALRLTLTSTNKLALPRSLNSLFYACWPITIAVVIGAYFNYKPLLQLSTWLSLALAIIALVSVEQVFRFSANSSRQIKLICLSLGIFFLYDVYLYSHAIIFQKFDLFLWQSRAAVSMAISLFMALGTLLLVQRGEHSTNFTLSRPIAFYTTSLIAVGSLFMLLSLGGYYVRIYSGNWGSVVYSFMSIGAILLIATIFISSGIRSRAAVMVNKHLFRHKYDYRSEWLRLINFLAQPTHGDEANRRAFLAAASITKATGGALWVRQQDYFEPVFQMAFEHSEQLPKEAVDSPFCRTLLHSEWVYFPSATDDHTLSQHNELLPLWTESVKELWLIFPLISGEDLIGFMALCQPKVGTPLNWEDLDLLKTTGRQLASFLKLHQQSDELVENRQFDTYNKLVAFIIHDLNNLIAQQALMVKNAEKHKGNPDFIDDAINTISNSVDRMRNLLKKLKRGNTELVQRIKIVDAIAQAVAECQTEGAKITLSMDRGEHYIQADQVRLVMTISHFIKNAQDASDDGGKVHVTLRLQPTTATIAIEDAGCGMEWEFIHNRLFKPFDTTKSGKGMGIGAYLSREYIKELYGNLDVTSKVGKGTRISFSLPVIQPQPETPNATK